MAPGGTGEISGFNATGDGRAGGNPLVLRYSDDLDATVEAVRAPGVTIATGPYEFPGGRRFHFTDPSGNELGGDVAGSRIVLNRRGVRPVTK